MSKSSVVALVIIGFLAFQVNGARPFTVDDAGTVEKNGFELEVASNYWKDAFDGGIGLKHGITDRMDIGIGFGYTSLPEIDEQHTPLQMGFKYAIIPDLLSASLSASFGEPSYAVNLIASKSIGIVSFNGNVGMETQGETKGRAVTYGLAAVFQTGPVVSGLELRGIDDSIQWWQIGAQLSIREWLAIDMGLGGDFEDEMSLTVTSGVWVGF